VTPEELVAPNSPSWTTVSTKVKKGGGVAAPRPEVKESNAVKTTGEAVDLYYDQKELFVKGWTRDAKQSRNTKMKRKVDYQVDKRRQQSERDKAAMAADFDEDDF